MLHSDAGFAGHEKNPAGSDVRGQFDRCDQLPEGSGACRSDFRPVRGKCHRPNGWEEMVTGKERTSVFFGEKERETTGMGCMAYREDAVIRCDLCQNAESVFLCVSLNQG